MKPEAKLMFSFLRVVLLQSPEVEVVRERLTALWVEGGPGEDGPRFAGYPWWKLAKHMTAGRHGAPASVSLPANFWRLFGVDGRRWWTDWRYPDSP